MTIDLKTVKHISKLSRISIEEEKAKKLSDDLNSIFSFIEKLNEKTLFDNHLNLSRSLCSRITRNWNW